MGSHPIFSMRRRYSDLAFAGILSVVSSICYASIPRDDFKPKLEEAVIGNANSEEKNLAEQVKNAAEFLSIKRDWINCGTVYVNERFYVNLNKRLGGKVKNAEAFSAKFEVINGEIDVITDKYYKSGKYPTVIPINCEMENGEKRKVVIEVNIIEKSQ